MLKSKVRGLVVSFSSSIVIIFVVFFFAPLLPFDVIEGTIGIIFFLIVILVSYIVYSLLPPDITNQSPPSQNLSFEDYVNNEVK